MATLPFVLRRALCRSRIFPGRHSIPAPHTAVRARAARARSRAGERRTRALRPRAGRQAQHSTAKRRCFASDLCMTARRNARPRPGSTSECECLAGGMPPTPPCRTPPVPERPHVGAGGGVAVRCLRRPGSVAPIDDAQAPCQMCPSNSTFFCSGNTQPACADHARVPWRLRLHLCARRRV